MVNVNAEFDTTRADQRDMVTRQNADASAWNAMTPEQRAAQANGDRITRFEQRVANGTMTNLGNGRYQVSDPGSWDDGEVFQVQRSRSDLRELLVMPEHGLDTTTGQVAFYSRTPEWHQFGTIIPAGLSSIPAVLKAARINFDVLQRPAGGWGEDASGVPVFYPEEGKFQNYRSDTRAPLGIVGKIFTSVQPSESMTFLQGLVEDDSVIIESAGGLDGGRRIFLSCLLPESMVIDATGIADDVQLHVCVFDRFDGQGQFQAVVTPWRPRCGNTERFALRDAVTRWGIRHTKNAKARVAEAQRTLTLTNAYAKAFVAEETDLARNNILLDEFTALVDEIFERDRSDESAKQVTVNDRRQDQLVGCFQSASEEVGPTAYAAERAFTDWLDHTAPRRVTGDKLAAARATAALTGSDDDRKDAVHQRLMMRVR